MNIDSDRHFEGLKEQYQVQLDAVLVDLRKLETRRGELEAKLEAIAVLTQPDDTPENQVPEPAPRSKWLGGERLAKVAAEVALPLGDVHYTRIFKELRKLEYKMASPAALLTSISNSPQFDRVGRGTYRVRAPRPRIVSS